MMGRISISNGDVKVEQGPEWFVQLAVDPPAWIYVALFLIVASVISLAALGYRRNGGLDDEVLEEMGEIGTIVISILVASHLWVSTYSVDYFADIVAGTVIGFVAARSLIFAIDQVTSSDPPRQRESVSD